MSSSSTQQVRNTAGSALADLRRRLREAGIGEPGVKAEWLVSRALGVPRLDLPLHHADPLTPARQQALAGMTARLLRHEPLQYVLGDAEFMGHRFFVDARALVPRPETERLVELALAREAVWKQETPCIADVGTGSGCIVISLALARPRGNYIATDTSAEALALAKENARYHGVNGRIAFRHSDLLACVATASLDLVVSNPPYISTADYARLAPEIVDHEPRPALDGGANGLECVERLVEQAARTLRPGGVLLLETGEEQASRVAARLKGRGFRAVRVHKDLAGKDRVIEAES